MLRVGTICSGIGAPEKALHNLGIECELAYFCEFDKFAAESYCAIHGVTTDKNLGDLTKVDIVGLPHDLDLLVGGTPCQDFSNAGLRKGGEVGSGTRSSLMWNFVQIIRETQPKAVLWENVPGCLSGDMKPNYDKFFNALWNAGYKVHSQILNAKYFGVPQNRDRVFVLAVRQDITNTFETPVGYDCGIRLKDVLEKRVHEKYFLSDKQVLNLVAENERKKTKGLGFKFEPTDGSLISKIITTRIDRLESQYIKESNRCIELTHDQPQANRIYSADGISVTIGANGGGLGAKSGLYQIENEKRKLCNHLIKNGLVKENDVIRHSYTAERMKKWSNRNVECNNMAPTLDTRCDCLGVIVKDEPIAYDEQNNRLRQDGYVGTIMTDGSTPKHNNRIIENCRIRKLTPRECFRLMGFADSDFDACRALGISDAQLYKQAGNSIVVNVLMALFGELYGVEWQKKVYGDRYKTKEQLMAEMPLLNWQVG